VTEQLASEARIRAAWGTGNHEQAAVLLLECYGAELYSFLLARFHGKPTLAEDAFSEFSEDLWKGLPKFEWRCSIRSWSYKLARSAATRVVRSPYQRAGRRESLSEHPSLEQAVAQARTSTAPYLRTDVKEGFAQLKDGLSVEDRELLTLRIDRDLSWRDIAFVVAADEDPSGCEDLTKLEAALRQRFSELKKRLRRLASDSGLL
jgi:RNA polymerase sigma-70 factor (ECF subfamily)